MRYGYFIGIGSNIEPVRHVGTALHRLWELSPTLEVSRIAETVPDKLDGDGHFLNTVVYFESDLDQPALKDALNRIEVMLGRDRADPGRSRKSRTIDLDILLQVPLGTRAIDPAQVTREPYHRPQLIELLQLRRLACPLEPPPLRNIRAIALNGQQVGLSPFTLERCDITPPGTVRHRRAALVTGAAVRLGKEIAGALARAGYDIALHYNSSRAEAEAAAEEFRASGVQCELFRQDLSDCAGIGDFLCAVRRRMPHLWVLVNSASTYEHGRIAETTPDMLDRLWSVNFRAPFFLMQAFHQQVGCGAIINILDNKIAYNQYQYAAYLSAKKALAELTRMAALEFAPGISVNGIAPGVVMPAASRGEDYLEWRRAGIPANALGSPAALCAMLLAVLQNPFMTGQIVFVDGGEGMNFTGRNAPMFEAPSGLAAATADGA